MKINNNLLTYFLANSLFLGGGLSIIFSLAGHDAYIAALIGIITGIGLIYLINQLKVKSLHNKGFIYILFKIIYGLYLITIICLLLVDLSTFLFSYFLPYTPAFISCLPFIFIAVYLGSKNITSIYYMAVAIIPISIAIIILKNLLLIGEIEFSNIFPILVIDKWNLLKASGIYALLSTVPYFLLIDEDIEFKKSLKYYLLSCLLNLLVIFTVIGVLGEMVNTFSYPEYSVLRRIKIFDFIENIENFISISWFLDIYIALSLIGYKMKKLFKYKKTTL